MVLTIAIRSSLAGTIDYHCRITQTVSQVTRLAPKAEMPQESSAALATGPSTIYYGQEFTIVKGSGAIAGSGLLNSSWADKVIILNQGSSEDAFTEMILGAPTANGGRHTMYIEVKEYSLGDTKPFVAIGYGGPVVFGLCKAE